MIGAVLLYLVIALAFKCLCFCRPRNPQSVQGCVVRRCPNAVSSICFVTLTSTGYGDIVPIHPPAQLVQPRSVIGQLLRATLLARLVMLEVRGHCSNWRHGYPACRAYGLPAHQSAIAALPLNSTGPVGRPVGEPEAGSSVSSNN
jgi:hypothetical protein